MCCSAVPTQAKRGKGGERRQLWKGNTPPHQNNTTGRQSANMVSQSGNSLILFVWVHCVSTTQNNALATDHCWKGAWLIACPLNEDNSHINWWVKKRKKLLTRQTRITSMRSVVGTHFQGKQLKSGRWKLLSRWRRLVSSNLLCYFFIKYTAVSKLQLPCRLFLAGRPVLAVCPSFFLSLLLLVINYVWILAEKVSTLN